MGAGVCKNLNLQEENQCLRDRYFRLRESCVGKPAPVSDALKSQELFVSLLKDKNRVMQEMFRTLMTMVKGSNEKNDRQFNRVMDHVMQQSETINNLLENQGRQLARLEQQYSGEYQVADGNDDYTGQELNRMIIALKEESYKKYFLNQPVAEILAAAKQLDHNMNATLLN